MGLLSPSDTPSRSSERGVVTQAGRTRDGDRPAGADDPQVDQA